MYVSNWIEYLNRDEEIKWLSWMEVQFKKIAGDDGEISLDEFKNALGVKKVIRELKLKHYLLFNNKWVRHKISIFRQLLLQILCKCEYERYV